MTLEPNPTALEILAQRIYQGIARQFPICCASDEFYFFPQMIAAGADRWGWDDFSTAGVAEYIRVSKQWETKLAQLDGTAVSDAERIDAELLLRMLQTLRAQVHEFAPQKCQPTFHLSIIVAGLGEALESEDPAAWRQRTAGLTLFLERATDLLGRVPEPFLRLGQQMLNDLQSWFRDLQQAGINLGGGELALRQFAEALKQISTRESFALRGDLFERLLTEHLGCDSSSDTIEQELRSEYVEMDDILTAEVERLCPGQPWQHVESRIPFLVAPDNDLRQLYRPELLRLEAHARQVGIIPDIAARLQPELAEVPERLAAIRASDAYSARVGHPATGGIFYLYQREQSETGRVGRTLEYRMTAAHEAWPGHHLLDVCRWNQPRPIRRPLEMPLFYEGWACFAEQLMAETGYFDNPWDRFLLARRRIERAARGLVDIRLQTGRATIEDSVQLLVQVGYPRQKAASVVPKYALRPGYQVCYTLGLRRMLLLRERYKAMETASFVRQVLAQGEIDFATLQDVLLNKGD